jgi:hypothetical protein
MRKAIHNSDAKRPTFRSKGLLNRSGRVQGCEPFPCGGVAERGRVKLRIGLLVLLLMCQPAMAGQRILLIRGLMDYVPGISPMSLLKSRLTDEGYEVTMITHLNDGFYKNQYWDAVIGHSQGAIDALRDAPDFARYNPRLTIIAVDPPRTSVLFHCVPGVRYLDLHTGDFGLGGGSLSCPQAQNLAMGGLHITLPMRSDAQEQILAYLRQDRPIEMAYAEPADVSPHVSLPPIKPKQSLAAIKPKPQPPKLADEKLPDEKLPYEKLPYERLPDEKLADGKLADAKLADENLADAKPVDDTSFDARFTAVWAGASNVLGPPVIPWTEHSYAGVLN